MEYPSRPPNTQLFVSEQYVSDLEEKVKEQDVKVKRWKKYMGYTMDFLEILREHFEGFDKLMKHFNEASDGVTLVVTPDESIKFKVDESKKGQDNS